MTLEGNIVMTIGSSAIPDQYKVRNARSNQLALLLTGLDVAPNGDIYVADGYASDYIHRFDRTGRYLGSFGGKNAPYSFNTLHKLAIDTRFTPARLIACDRANNRVVHLSLEGVFLDVVAKDLLLPAAIAIDGDNAIVGELTGRVTVLDKAGSGREPRWHEHGAGCRVKQAAARAVARGLRAGAARCGTQHARRSLRLRVQRLRARSSIQSTELANGDSGGNGLTRSNGVTEILVLKTNLRFSVPPC